MEEMSAKSYFSKEYVTLRTVLSVAICLLMNITWAFIVAPDHGGISNLIKNRDMLTVIALSVLETIAIVETSFYVVWRSLCRGDVVTWKTGVISLGILAIASAVYASLFGMQNLISVKSFTRSFLTDFITSALSSIVFLNSIQKDRLNELLMERERILAEKSRLAEASAIAQSDAMNMRIDNHFFFNSLNILASLIGEDPGKAEEFLLELSDTHRRIIELGSAATITVKEELELVGSYMRMTFYRFGNESIRLVIDDGIQEYANAEIIPLSLLHAVENAIKHNSYSKSNPLVIRVGVESSGPGKRSLTVRNNKMEKISKPVSTGQGLENIRKKYCFVSGQTPVVEDSADTFTVKLPLIEKWRG